MDKERVKRFDAFYITRMIACVMFFVAFCCVLFFGLHAHKKFKLARVDESYIGKGGTTIAFKVEGERFYSTKQSEYSKIRVGDYIYYQVDNPDFVLPKEKRDMEMIYFSAATLIVFVVMIGMTLFEFNKRIEKKWTE